MTPSAADKHEPQRTIEELHARYQPLSDGQVATYIPELQKANPDDFGICIATADGAVFETGDRDRPFTIQSVSKPFTFGMAVEDFGADTVASTSASSRAATSSIRSSFRATRTARTTR
jgi:glutaminase